MTLREELIAIINRLPEEELAVIAPAIRDADEKKQQGWEAHLAQARAFRTRMKKRYGLTPDSVETVRHIREERLNDIMGLR
jgi:hypothetical protein